MLKVAICDDVPQQLEIIKAATESYFDNNTDKKIEIGHL